MNDGDLCECRAERAAILEYDAGVRRRAADAEAAREPPLCDGCGGPQASDSGE